MEKDKQQSKKEMRYISTDMLEVREIGDSGSTNNIVYGYVTKFNKQSEVLRDRWGDEFVEVIAQGAFDESLQTKTQKALWNHNTDYVLGSVRAGTLALFIDNEGLRSEITLPNTTWGNDAYEAIRRKDVDGMSFGFRAIEDRWDKILHEDREIYRRTIIKAELYEVSPCVFPAYPDSEIDCRSLHSYKTKANNDELRKKLILRTYL